MPIRGTPKFDGIVVASFEADFKATTIKLDAEAAFVDTRSGETHGWTRGSGHNWSKETMLKLQELRESMETDLAQRHFDHPETSSVRQVNSPNIDAMRSSEGLGEHLGSDVEAPSI